MSRISATKSFHCPVISETVSIKLARRLRFGVHQEYFVKCSEADCQYIDSNVPPCPLTLAIFAAEMESRAARRAEAP